MGGAVERGLGEIRSQFWVAEVAGERVGASLPALPLDKGADSGYRATRKETQGHSQGVDHWVGTGGGKEAGRL